MKYQLFANKLNRKMLTVRQLTYLHNSVLLPKVEYRMMCTILSEPVCKSIAVPMRKIIKHAEKFSNTLSSSFLHLDQGLQLTDLHACIIQNHVSTLTIRLNSSEILSGIYHHRIHNLQDALWTQFTSLISLISQFENILRLSLMIYYVELYILRPF